MSSTIATTLQRIAMRCTARSASARRSQNVVLKTAMSWKPMNACTPGRIVRASSRISLTAVLISVSSYGPRGGGDERQRISGTVSSVQSPCASLAAGGELLRATETLGRRVQHVGRLAEGEADEVPAELRPRVKGGAGNAGDAHRLHQPVRERDVVVEAERGDVAEDVVRTLRRARREAGALERGDEQIAAGAGRPW